MTRAILETQVLNELRHLPLQQAQEALDFIIFLRSRIQKNNQPKSPRPLGIMQGKAFCQIAENFEISDEELLQL